MASHDQGRRKKESDETGVESQFESLTVSPPQQSGGGIKAAAAEHGGGETARPQNVGKFEMQGGEQGDADITKYRQAAQQNSMDALRAAEERYNKAKEEKSAQPKEKGQPLYETARETLAGAGKTAVDYTGQAKDYVGSVATTVKDKGVVAGWGAGEYTAEKVVDATKAVANVTAGAAGYVGGTAVAAKDKVGSVGLSAKDYGAQKLGAAKDAVVATQESAKEYAARKRQEAEREMVAKQSAQTKGEVWSRPGEEIRDDIAAAGVEQGGGSEAQGVGGGGGGGGGGVLQDIGETVLEIGQTTKELLVGKGPTQSTVKDSEDLNK